MSAQAYEGNVLESINLVLNPFDEHHIDRDLSRTGLSIMVVTPGVGYFNVDKTMLRLTTERLLDAGFTIDMICMSQIPLHVTPLFSYWSRPLPPPKKEEDRDTAQGEIMAELSADSRGRFSSTRMHDLLYWDVPEDGTAEQLIFCESIAGRFPGEAHSASQPCLPCFIATFIPSHTTDRSRRIGLSLAARCTRFRCSA